MKSVDERNMKEEGTVQTDERGGKKTRVRSGELKRHGQKVGILAFI